MLDGSLRNGGKGWSMDHDGHARRGEVMGMRFGFFKFCKRKFYFEFMNIGIKMNFTYIIFKNEYGL